MNTPAPVGTPEHPRIVTVYAPPGLLETGQRVLREMYAKQVESEKIRAEQLAAVERMLKANPEVRDDIDRLGRIEVRNRIIRELRELFGAK